MVNNLLRDMVNGGTSASRRLPPPTPSGRIEKVELTKKKTLQTPLQNPTTLQIPTSNRRKPPRRLPSYPAMT